MSKFQNMPKHMTLQAHVKYALCLCGESNTFPMCDGSHKQTTKKPYKFTLDKEEKINICQCGKSKTLPHCDGSHFK